ncbi:Epimerase domain-containing protein [Hirschfeldia incana]|nr:Epimerase domain-containing protein [Hirschfeldia incana]
MEMNGGGRVVCVTGASGYIASWIVKLLLLRGYTVKATVRDPKDQKKTDHLLALDGARERLQLFKASLLEEGSFEHAIDGCEAVFHTASPVKITATDPQQWYILSKTLAESAAWGFAKDNNLDLVVMNPGLVIGPVLQPTINFSVDVVVDFIKGKNTFNRKYHRLVDVRDVALAHVKALETLSAKGRYIIDAPIVTTEEIENILREFFPDLCISHENGGIDMNSMTYKVDVEKVKSLGVEFTPIETSLRDTVLSLKEKHLV